MFVHQILKSKADEGVVSIVPGTKVADAVALLSLRRIGTLVVSKDGKSIEGILSERDIVREIGLRGVECLDEPVDNLMTSSIITCHGGERADQILETMTQGRFRHMPVVENGEMIGLISIGDVVKARLAELASEKDAMQEMIMGH